MPDPAVTAAGRPSDLGLLWRQVRAQNKLFLRNPFSAFFSLAFPVMFLLLFGSLNGSGRIPELHNIRYIQFLAPGMLAFAVISTCYTGLVTGVAINRDEGLLKRVRGTPLPPWVYITARILSAVWFSMVSAVVMVVAAVLLFRVELIGRMLPAAAVTLLAGAACFCALGMAVAAVIPNGEAAPVIADLSSWLADVARPASPGSACSMPQRRRACGRCATSSRCSTGRRTRRIRRRSRAVYGTALGSGHLSQRADSSSLTTLDPGVWPGVWMVRNRSRPTSITMSSSRIWSYDGIMSASSAVTCTS
jgi:ABC-type transport system involved in cytochrome c biogenesis permease component